MKRLAINASHRGDRGRTRFLLDRLFHGATEAGAECEIVTLNYIEPKSDGDIEDSRVRAVCAAYEQAGRELATLGHIRPATQRQANRELVPEPLFGLLRRLPFRPLKKLIAAGAREVTQAAKAKETSVVR